MTTKFLLITSIFPPQSGGPAIFTERYANWLTKQSIHHKVITYCVKKTANQQNLIQIQLGNLRILSFLNFIVKICMNSNKSTTILANGAFLETYLACKFTGRNYVIKLPGDHVWEYSRNKNWTKNNIEDFQKEKLNLTQKTLRYLLNLAYKNCTYLISPSNQLSKLARIWGVPNKKIIRINNSVDSAVFKMSLKSKKKFDLITICRLVPWKGLEELIDVTIKMNLSLAIIGDGPLLNKLKLRGKNAKIIFMGNQPNKKVIRYLQSSKFFVLNSEYEATSYALIEAKMCGIPTIARSTSGSKTVINNLKDGFLFSGLGQDTLENTLKHIFKLKSKNFVGLKAREDALKRFNQEINFKKIYNVAVR